MTIAVLKVGDLRKVGIAKMTRHINPNECDCVDPYEVTHDHSCKNYCDRCDCVHCKESNQSEVCRECIACDEENK